MSRPVPLDPMYARFRERHPDVALVMLPAGADAEQEHLDAAPDPVEAEHALEQTRDEVGALLTDVCALLELEGRIEVHWRSGSGPGTVQATATVHAPLAATPEGVTAVLTRLGWRTRVTSRAPVLCIDAQRTGHQLRIVVHEGSALLTLRGDDVVVGGARALALVNPEGVTRG